MSHSSTDSNSPTTNEGSNSSTGGKGGLATADIIAIAVAVPGSIAGIVGAYYGRKQYNRKYKAKKAVGL